MSSTACPHRSRRFDPVPRCVAHPDAIGSARGWRHETCFVPLALALLALFACADGVRAGELIDLQVTDQEGVYHVRMEMHVDAPSDDVYRVLTDFAHIYRLNPAITESRTLPSTTPGVTRVRTRIEDCILLHCVTILRVEEIREAGPGRLHVETDPGPSDFRSGTARWRVEPEGAGSLVIYEASMEPDFFLPPLLGRMFMKKGLRDGIKESFENLERIARLDARPRSRSYLALRNPH